MAGQFNSIRRKKINNRPTPKIIFANVICELLENDFSLPTKNAESVYKYKHELGIKFKLLLIRIKTKIQTNSK